MKRLEGLAKVERDRLIRQMAKDGITREELAEIFHLSLNTLRGIAPQRNGKPPKK